MGDSNEKNDEGNNEMESFKEIGECSGDRKYSKTKKKPCRIHVFTHKRRRLWNVHK